MEQRKLDFIKCECGREVSVRALTRHLKGTVNNHSEEYINKCTKLINWQRTDRWAWIKADGVEAIGDPYWCVKVLNGELSLDDLSFISPRIRGSNPPKSLAKISKERMGKGNPSLKNKPIYNIEELREFAIKEFIALGEDPGRFKKIDSILENTFPEYRYSFVGMYDGDDSQRGHNRRNLILSYLINRPIEWIVEHKALDRGNFIKTGQRKSPKFKNIQNAARGTFKTKSRITIPHRVLFNMVLSIDPEAYKERQIDFKDTWKSYDIYSPIQNILIEMHGRIWHDLNGCPNNIKELVLSNIKNDEIKEQLAQDSGCRLFVFWDDECDIWEDQLEEIYGKQPKPYKEALREELDKKRNGGSI